MPRARKLLIHGLPYFITFRTEEGLPFSPAGLLSDPIWGILARAQHRYPVDVCAFVFMTNHVHLLLVAKNPEHIPHFVRHVKTETAHLVNKLLGRRRRTLWSAGYDCVAVLTVEQCIDRICYIYANPQKARLESLIENYPLPNSWLMFFHAQSSRKCSWIRRPMLSALAKTLLKLHEQRALARRIKAKARSQHLFRLEPFAWMESFPETNHLSRERVREEIVRRVRELERMYSQDSPKVAGAVALCEQDMARSFSPNKYGRRMICMCSDKPKRKAFLEFYFELAKIARDVFQEWRRGVFNLPFPPGMFTPGGGYYSSLLPFAIPIPISS